MKKLLFAAALAAAGVAYWRHGSAPVAAQDSHLAFDRIWIDHMPRNERDIVQIFAALDDSSFGIFDAVSQWTGAYEIFQFEANGGDVRAVYPQTGKKEKFTLDAKACDVRGFDYCLEIKGSDHGVKRYYSQEDWIIDGQASADARIHAILGR